MSINRIFEVARQTGKETMRRAILDALLDETTRGKRQNLILFCIRAHLSGQDKHPDWWNLWLKELLLAVPQIKLPRSNTTDRTGFKRGQTESLAVMDDSPFVWRELKNLS